MSVVLVVDDEEQALRLITFNLKKHNYNVLTATNGLEALDILHNNHVDIIITDLIMPYMDGIELIGKIKEDEKFQTIPLIVVSSKKTEKFVMDALRLGISDFITKPFNDVELIIRVKRAF